jgi:hypothetical protein
MIYENTKSRFTVRYFLLEKAGFEITTCLYNFLTVFFKSCFQISSAMSLTSLNGVYVSNEINRFFPMNGKVTVNATLVLIDNSHTRSLVVKRDIQKKLIEVIQVRSNVTVNKIEIYFFNSFLHI